MEQRSLFDHEVAKKMVTTNTLVIGKQANKTISKSQQMFNRLTKKIETLQAQIQETAKKLDARLAFYVCFLYPIEQNLAALRKEAVKRLYPFYTDKKGLQKNERETLKKLIVSQLDHIFRDDSQCPDDEIKRIFETMCSQKYDDVIKEEFEEMKDSMAAMFASEGMEIDLQGIEMETGPAVLLRKLQEQMEKLSQYKSKENTTRKKTKKQIKTEALETEIKEASKRNLNSIYRQLAKVLHPDLEQDPTIREEKETLMRHLTSAYAANDLHTLLRLEMQWINKENTHLETLSEETLGIYNRLLKQQAQEMEEEHSRVINHPKYLPLENFSNGFVMPDINTLKSARKAMERTVCSLENSIKNLKGSDPLTEIRDVLLIFSCSLAVP